MPRGLGQCPVARPAATSSRSSRSRPRTGLSGQSLCDNAHKLLSHLDRHEDTGRNNALGRWVFVSGENCSHVWPHDGESKQHHRAHSHDVEWSGHYSLRNIVRIGNFNRSGRCTSGCHWHSLSLFIYSAACPWRIHIKIIIHCVKRPRHRPAKCVGASAKPDNLCKEVKVKYSPSLNTI